MRYDDPFEEPTADELEVCARVHAALTTILKDLGLVRSRKPLAAHNAAVDIIMELEYRGISIIVDPVEPTPAEGQRFTVINGGRT
jgi:hypothetical protein